MRGFLLLTAITLHLAAAFPAAGKQPSPGRIVLEVVSEARGHGEEEPIRGAEVRGAGLLVLTDEGGIARFTLPPGEYRVEVRAFAHEPESVRLEVESGRELRVRVRLHPLPFEGGGIVVRSTRTGQRVQDEPLRVEVLDREEIEEKLLMRPGNISMLLAETGGLRVQVTSPSLGASNLRIQGMRGRYTLLLADGLPLYGGQAGGLGLLQIPPSDLGQVEIIKGAASALYGGAALGGVVNLISRAPEEERAAEYLLNVTSRGGGDMTAYHTGPLGGGWGYSVLAGAHHQGARDLDGSGWIDVPSHRRWTARPRIAWEGEGGGTFLATAGGMTETRAGGTRAGVTLADGRGFPESLETNRYDLGVSAMWPLGEATLLQLRGSSMRMDHRHERGASVEEGLHRTDFAEIALSRTVGPSSWVLGGAFQRDAFRPETFPAFDYAFTTPALFAQSEFRISRRASASASVRWDAHSEYGDHLSPRVSLLLRPEPWTVRASAGGGFFAPTPFLEEIEAAGLAFLSPLEGLRSERVRTASLELGRAVGPIETHLALFGSRVRHPTRLVPVAMGSGGEPGVRVVNAEGEARTAGSELLVRARRGDFSLTGSHVFVRATEPEPEGPGRRDIPLTPRHTTGLVGMWEDHDRGLFGVEAYFTGRQELDDNPYRSTSRRHVHLGVLAELRRGGTGYFVNAENLLDFRQTRHHPLTRETRAPDGRWTVDAWGPLEGFVVNAGVRIRFGADDPH